MKGIILKDLYAMGGLYRNTLLALAIVCVCMGLSIGAGGIAAATSVICAPRARIAVKAACPGVSIKVRPSHLTRNADGRDFPRLFR